MVHSRYCSKWAQFWACKIFIASPAKADDLCHDCGRKRVRDNHDAVNPLWWQLPGDLSSGSKWRRVYFRILVPYQMKTIILHIISRECLWFLRKSKDLFPLQIISFLKISEIDIATYIFAGYRWCEKWNDDCNNSNSWCQNHGEMKIMYPKG